MEKIHREIEDATSDRFAIQRDMFFVEMPAAWSRKQYGGLVVELVRFAVLFQRDGAQIRIAQIDLSVNHVVPRRAIRVFKIGHEGICAAVKRIDHHLAICRAGNFDAAILDIFWHRRHHPIAVADPFC